MPGWNQYSALDKEILSLYLNFEVRHRITVFLILKVQDTDPKQLDKIIHLWTYISTYGQIYSPVNKHINLWTKISSYGPIYAHMKFHENILYCLRISAIEKALKHIR